MSDAPLQPTDDPQDSQIVRLTFRVLVQRCIVLSAFMCFVHGVLVGAAGDLAWTWCAVFFGLNIPLFWLTGPERPYPVFLASVIGMLALETIYISGMLQRFGGDAGFQYLLLLAVPLVMISGRISQPAKWIVVVALALYLVNLDALSRASSASAPSAAELLPYFRAINIAGVPLMLATFTQYYFVVIARAQARLIEHASIDPLTGLFNRRSFMAIAGGEIARSRRQGSSLAVILADLDHFKAVNDCLGHEAGDTVLRHASGLLKAAARDGDILCRWGGEEFLLLLPQTDAQNALHIAERIRDLLADEPLDIDGQRLRVTLTLGVATVHAQEPLEEAIRRADAALYLGKAAGRNRATLAEASTATVPVPVPATPRETAIEAATETA